MMDKTARQGLLATGDKGPAWTSFAGQWIPCCTGIAVDIHGKAPSAASDLHDSTGPKRAGRSAGFGIKAAVPLSRGLRGCRHRVSTHVAKVAADPLSNEPTVPHKRRNSAA